MRFLGIAYMSLGREAVFPTSEFVGIFNRVKLKSEDFTPDNFKPGTSGQTELYRKLQADTKLDESSVWKGGVTDS